MRSELLQRLRVTYRVAGPLCYTSVLDMGRLWERLLRRAGVPLAYTQGFSPHPRLQFASALPVGYGSTCEVLDIWLADRMEPAAFREAVAGQAPLGLAVLGVEEAPLKAEPLQGAIRAADYRVCLWTAADRAQVEAALARTLARSSIARRRIKKGRLCDYDLRPLIGGLDYRSFSGACHEILMTLACGPQGAGRPEEVIDELALPVTRYTIQRLRLIQGDRSPQAVGDDDQPFDRDDEKENEP